MNTFTSHLWREWREQRRAILFLFLALAAVIAGLAFAIPDAFLGGKDSVGWVMVLSVGTAMVALGSDLFARERQSGTDALLARLPNGLNRAFQAKLGLFLVLVAGSALYGMFLGIGANFATRGGVHEGSFSAVIFAILAVYSLVVALWIFCAASWVRSAPLAVPVAALFLGVALAPLLRAMITYQRQPSNAAFITFLALAAMGAIASAWLTFVRGRSVLVGVGVGALFFVPSWAWAGVNSPLFSRGVLAETIRTVYLGEGHRFAFVNLELRWTGSTSGGAPKRPTALVVDLESGEVRRAGVPGRSTWNLPRDSWRSWRGFAGRGFPALELFEDCFQDRPDQGSEPEPQLVDGRTGKPYVRDPLVLAQTAFADAHWPDTFRFDDEVSRSCTPRGAGFCGTIVTSDRRRHSAFWEAGSNLVVTAGELAGAADGHLPGQTFVLPGRWLIKTKRKQWSWFDPASKTRRPAEAIGASDAIELVFDDGSLLVIRAGELLRVHSSTGDAVAVATDGEVDRWCQFGLPSDTRWLSGSARIAANVTAYRSGRLNHGVAIFDATSNAVELIHVAENHDYESHEEGLQLVSLSQSPEFALVLSGALRGQFWRQLKRLDLGTGELQTLLDLDTLE